ncbi:MAG: tape measure protein, partial [Gammaproteobacteria bacterium]|nr:tape measure protein [Gammaproteobacteria bacterium]
MALKLGSLFYDIEGDTSPLKNTEKEVGRSTKRMGRSFGALGKVIAAALSVETLRRFIKIADSMTRLQGRIKVVTRNQKEFNEAMKETFRIANDIGIAVDGTIVAFQRFSLVRDVVKASNKDILNFTETIQKLGIISGSTSDEVRSTSIQIGQALTNNFTSAAQEINSINEQMPEVARTIERQLGLGFGAFKKEAVAGRITSEDFFNGILEAQEEVDRRFKEMPVTVERAMARVGNSVKVAAKDINEALEVTPKIVVLLNKFSGWIRIAAKGIIALFQVAGIQFDAFTKRMTASAVNPFEQMKNAAAQTSIRFQIMWQKFEIAVAKADLKLLSLPGMRWLAGFDKTTQSGVDDAILKLSALEAVLKDFESLDPLKKSQERIAAINAERDARIFAIRAELAEFQISQKVKQASEDDGGRVGAGAGGVFVDGREVLAGPVSAIDQIIADMGNETQEILNQLRERNQLILEATKEGEEQRAELIRSSRAKASRSQMKADLALQQIQLAATAGFLDNMMNVLAAAGK